MVMVAKLPLDLGAIPSRAVGNVAQRLECQSYKLEVGGSIPPIPIMFSKYLECVICNRMGSHATVHMSNILYEDERFGFKWRVYWIDDDWGSYIVDEVGQVFDFWKFSDVRDFIRTLFGYII